MNRNRQILKYVLTDLIAAAVVWFLFNLVRYNEVAQYQFKTLQGFLLFHKVITVQSLIPFFWLMIYFLSGYYNKPFEKTLLSDLFITVISVLTGVILIFFSVVLNDLPESFEIYYKLFFSLLGLQFLITYTGRAVITAHALGKVRCHEWYETVLIIGTGSNAVQISNILVKSGYHIHGFISVEDTETPADVKVSGTLNDISEILKKNRIDELMVAVDGKDVVPLLYNLYQYRRPVKVMIDNNNLLTKAKVTTIHSLPVIDIAENNFSEAEKNIKWLVDKIFSATVLTILSPLFLYIAIRVKKDSKGPVFFKQERIGYMGKPFTIYKFRTMYSESAGQGPLLTARDDKRVTPFGRFLRKYRLDEIPQFWNVLRGDMSIVGPRPEQRFYIDMIVRKAPYYYLLHNVRPGITSLGMVRYGYAETVDKMIERLKFDIVYYENMSLIMDFAIILYTVKIVLTGKGV